MASKQELQVQQKRELEKKEEGTVPARVFLPAADIYETDDALSVILEMPGVDKANVNISVKDDVLNVEGRTRFFQVSETRTGIHGVQHRPLCQELPALQQN